MTNEEIPPDYDPKGDISYWRGLFSTFKKSLGARAIKKRLAERDDFFRTRSGQNDIQRVLLDRGTLDSTRRVVLTLHALKLDLDTEPALGPRLIQAPAADVIRLGERAPESEEAPPDITLETLHETLAVVQLKQLLMEQDLEKIQQYLRLILEKLNQK